MELTKKQRDIVDLASVGGQDKDLVILQKIHSLEDKFDATVKDIKDTIPDLNKVLESVRGTQGIQGDMPSDEHLVSLIEPRIPEPVKGDQGDSYILTKKDKQEIAKTIKVPVVEKVIVKIETIKEQPIVTQEIKEVAVAESAEDLRNKLEALPDGDRLAISSIQNLQEELDKLKKSVGTGGHAVFASQRGAVKLYDLSASLNGVLKTFSLPAFWRVINVTSSSFPNAFRPTVDYVTDGGLSTITFDAGIDASTTLASGQTLLVEYAEG